jgi:hypothetical protein
MYQNKYNDAVKNVDQLYNQIEFEQNRSEIQMKKANDTLTELNILNQKLNDKIYALNGHISMKEEHIM